MRAVSLKNKSLLKAVFSVAVFFLVYAPLHCLPAGLGATPTIETFHYRGDDVAQTAWIPMRGSLPVKLATEATQRGLRFECNFQSGIERASWDKKVDFDLSAGSGFELDIWCPNPTPISYFSLYFQSDAGWYHGTFYPEHSTGWDTLRIEKVSMGVEGKPTGWERITAIRISAWRGQNKDSEFVLRNLRQAGVLGADAVVAVIRGDSAGKRAVEEARSVNQYTESVTQSLRALGVGFTQLSDTNSGAGLLKHARLVVLPYNPSMPNGLADQVRSHLESGGKMLAFYVLPEQLRAAIGMGPLRHVKAAAPGNFACIRVLEGALRGAPTRVEQNSWNIAVPELKTGAGRIAAEWLDGDGNPTGQPAIIAFSNCLFMTHVLLPEDSPAKRRLLLAMAGSLVPNIWDQAAGTAMAQVGNLGGFRSYEEAAAGISRTGGKKAAVGQALTSAGKARESAAAFLRERRYAESMEQSEEANRLLNRAFCLAQESLPGEFRAFWCHSAFGVQDLTWDQAITRLADNGFTAIFPNMLWGGAAFYPSKVLPAAAPIATRGDQIAQCLAACRKHGIQLHVWKVNWNLGHAAPPEFVDQMRRAGRLQAGSEGKELLWLCPSHPDNQKLEIDSMVEAAREYRVDGLHFDYIRYPDSDHCFCTGCRERFSRAASVQNLAWPRDVLAEGSQRQKWLEWRRGNITSVVKAVSEKARAVNPKIKISAAVFPIWVNERDTIGQDWKLWCEKGYLDFVCPMDYTTSNSNFANMLRRQLEWAGKTPCFPGIGASASTSRFGADKVINQINIARDLRAQGFVIFNYGVNESRDLLPMLGLGITQEEGAKR